MASVNLLDPGLLGGLAGAVGAIIGALIGGGATYFAASHQFKATYKAAKWDALRALLVEIYDHMPSLYRDLDRSLPAWLARCHRRGGKPLTELVGYVQQTARYEDPIYKALLKELVSSQFGAEIATYFRRLNWLNGWVARVDEGEIDRSFSNYVLCLSNALLLGVELVQTIEAECRTSGVAVSANNLNFEAFSASRDDYLFAGQLAKFDLQRIEEFLATGRAPKYFPGDLAASAPERFEPYLKAARACSAWS